MMENNIPVDILLRFLDKEKDKRVYEHCFVRDISNMFLDQVNTVRNWPREDLGTEGRRQLLQALVDDAHQVLGVKYGKYILDSSLYWADWNGVVTVHYRMLQALDKEFTFEFDSKNLKDEV